MGISGGGLITSYAYIIMKIYKESSIKKSHKDSIRIVITHEDCGNIDILNNLWYNAINSINLNLQVQSAIPRIFSQWGMFLLCLVGYTFAINNKWRHKNESTTNGKVYST